MTINQRLIFDEAKDYAGITFGVCLYAFAYTLFLLPYEIVTGGVTGMAAVIYYATGFPIQNTYLIINIVLLIVGLRALGLKFLMKTIYAIILLYFMLWFAQKLMPVDAAGHYVKILGENQDFMSLMMGCMLTGTSLAIVFLNNGSTGGTDIIAASINKYYSFSLGQVLLTIDLCIIGSCMFFPQFGDILGRLHKVMFGLCTMVIENFMLDHVMNAQRESVQFMIFSKKSKEIADAIGTQMDRGITILDGHGWYTGQDMKVLCILARKRESTPIFRIIKMIDPDAFVSQSSVIGVYGEGFDHVKVKLPKNKQINIGKKEKNEDSIRDQQHTQVTGNP
ncbi:membrane protein [Hallella multisaccharivorax DSM 17128]|uniref:DUF2179 domain-containing protein n=1 Tax=Hallella multisaccharivorax DSM 17128 TaxID=688246 RepID=F8N5S2_9BACT|nr:YitT family protein [Hallella multisaccharivorax]EGN56084.1 Protein of unknown function DUF2179 [Hallella multisaccharivorax DSM 17128]GJG29580.1 membrane protein [Hallella multisaccharivorax DSM 17128]